MKKVKNQRASNSSFSKHNDKITNSHTIGLVNNREWRTLLQDSLPGTINTESGYYLGLETTKDPRHWLTVEVDIPRDNQASREIIVRLPASLVDRTDDFAKNRLRACLRYWLPACLQVQAKIGHSIRWRLSAADRGDQDALSMDSEEPDLLIPDLYAFEASKQIAIAMGMDNFNSFYHDWIKRKAVMFWRGSSTGIKSQCPIGDMEELTENDRVRACIKFRDETGFDLAISRLVQADENIKNAAEQWMTAERLLGPTVSEVEFKHYRFYHDLLGNGLAWGTIHKNLKCPDISASW